MNDFAISDIMVSDTSSIMYEYLVTSNPIIIVENNYDQLHNMPPELSILDVAKKYNGGSPDICKMINDELENNKTRKIYSDLLNNCFYHNDGKSTERAVDFIKSIQK
jgi:CDP-glycerol glycerophosphotransferase (TagB/SpsB family)